MLLENDWRSMTITSDLYSPSTDTKRNRESDAEFQCYKSEYFSHVHQIHISYTLKNSLPQLTTCWNYAPMVTILNPSAILFFMGCYCKYVSDAAVIVINIFITLKKADFYTSTLAFNLVLYILSSCIFSP